MTYYPSIWGSGAKWGEFLWGGADTSGIPKVFVAINEEPVGTADTARWRLGRSDWFDVLQPQNATITVAGEVEANPNDRIMISCHAGVLWSGFVDECTVSDDVADTVRTSITATDVIGRLGTAIKAPGRVEVSSALVARYFPVGTYTGFGDDLVEVTEGYLADYAADLAITVTEGPSTGTLPALTDWYFDAPGPMPKKSILEILNKAEQTSNAMMALQPDGSILITMRAASGLSTVPMAVLDDTNKTLVKRRGRTTVINRWLLERPAYYDDTVLDTSDPTSVGLYGEKAYEVQDYLCTTDTHFTTGLRTALAIPRWVGSATFPISDLGDPALMLAPLAWASLGEDVWQIMSVEHNVSVGSWDVTVELDASQDSLTGEPEPDPE